MKQTNHIGLAATLAASIAVASMLNGCDEKTQTELKEKAAAAQDKAGDALEAGKQKAAELGAEAQKAWDSLKAEYAPQVDTLTRRVESIKAEAAKFKDAQLDGYVADFEKRVGDIKAKLGESFSAEGMQSLKDNMGKWIDEAKVMYERAAARVAELTQAAGGG